MDAFALRTCPKHDAPLLAKADPPDCMCRDIMMHQRNLLAATEQLLRYRMTMDTRLVYFAHPLGDDVAGNLALASEWLAWLMRHEPTVCFVAPWFAYAQAWLADHPHTHGKHMTDAGAFRDRAMRDNIEQARRCRGGIVLCGHSVTNGMQQELDEVLAAWSMVEGVGLIASDLVGIASQPPSDDATKMITSGTGVLAFGRRRYARSHPPPNVLENGWAAAIVAAKTRNHELCVQALGLIIDHAGFETFVNEAPKRLGDARFWVMSHVAVMEGDSNALEYRIGLPSNVPDGSVDCAVCGMIGVDTRQIQAPGHCATGKVFPHSAPCGGWCMSMVVPAEWDGDVHGKTCKCTRTASSPS